MKKLFIVFVFCLMVVGGVVYISATPAACVDCNKGKQCSTSYDCGEIGVCYCQYSYETEQDTGGGIPAFGTCYFE